MARGRRHPAPVHPHPDVDRRHPRPLREVRGRRERVSYPIIFLPFIKLGPSCHRHHARPGTRLRRQPARDVHRQHDPRPARTAAGWHQHLDRLAWCSASSSSPTRLAMATYHRQDHLDQCRPADFTAGLGSRRKRGGGRRRAGLSGRGRHTTTPRRRRPARRRPWALACARGGHGCPESVAEAERSASAIIRAPNVAARSSPARRARSRSIMARPAAAGPQMVRPG